ncbi:MAG: polysaccharide biosynthesis tyrosine autokinase [Paludibacteraceae bacterium]|nr:polysaccharide biosynthesis tyrosine autokinase [Paludibacteraceae bacterium]
MAGRNRVNEELKVQTEAGKTDIKTVVFQYLKYWYLILMSVAVALWIGKVYHDSKIPLYSASAQILINDDSKGANNELAIFEGIAIEKQSTMETEILEMKSVTFIEKIITELKLYVNYIGYGRLSKKTDLYEDSPIVADVSGLSLSDLDFVGVWLHFEKNGTVRVSENGELTDASPVVKEFPYSVTTNYGEVVLHKKFDVDNAKYNKIFVGISNPAAVAREYISSLSLRAAGKGAPVLSMSVVSTNRSKGVDFLKALIEKYNKASENEKDMISQTTSKFIDDRIRLLSEELGTTERKIEGFKKNQGLIEVASNAQLVLQENTEYERKKLENETQIKLIEYLKSYIDNPKNKLSVMPSNIGIEDESLVSQVNRYNELLLEMDRLLNSTSENNPVVVNKKNQLMSLLGNIKILVDNILQGLRISQSDLDAQTSKYKKQMSNVPTQERRYLEIDRQRQIQASLFLMLLQKREENALAMAATVSKAKIVSEPSASFAPIAPNEKNIYMMSGLLGLAIPVGVIFLITFLSPLLVSAMEVKNYTQIPVISNLPICKNAVDVFGGESEDCAEAFRMLRTKILYNEEFENTKVFLFTSMKDGVGKTFVSKNLASSFVMLGKKVLLIDADLRRQSLSEFVEGGRGLTNYLTGEETDVESLIIKVSDTNGLSLLPAGRFKSNPSELLTSERLDEAISKLRDEYDYIFIDATDLSKYTDTLILNHVSDAVIAVARIKVSDKTKFNKYDELYKNNQLNNVMLVVNGVRN